MSDSPQHRSRTGHRLGSGSLVNALVRVVAPYVLVASAWIVLSDRVLSWLVPDPSEFARWSTVKGWGFVLVTGALLLQLVRREFARRERIAIDLRASEERHRLLFEATPYPMWVYDLETLRFVAVNAAAVRRYGYSRDEFLAMTIADIRPEEDVPRLAEFVRATPAGLSESGVWRHRHRDGTEVQVEITSHELELDGRRCRLVLALDVTARERALAERRELEEQLRQSQKLEAVGRLAGGVAHDFNNLLAVILLQAERLADDGIERADVVAGVEEIRGAAERGADLARQLLLFAQRKTPQRQALDLNEAVTTVATLLRRLIGEDVELDLRLQPGRIPLYADRGMLDQVIVNLAVNARDAMPGGGRLLVETGERQVAEGQAPEEGVPAGRYVRLRVRDDGAGIEPSVLPHLFEPFFTTKEPGKGTGLGLSTVFGIVRQHGGWIEVDSSPGEGATFDLHFPRVETEEREVPQRPPTARKAAPGGSETILLVEDEEPLRRIARLVLERNGYEVLEEGDGAEALRVWGEARDRIRLLLTDLVLPGGTSGRELAERLAAESPDLAIVWTSGYSADLLGRDLPSGPWRAFLQKPASSRALLEAVRSCLDG